MEAAILFAIAVASAVLLSVAAIRRISGGRSRRLLTVLQFAVTASFASVFAAILVLRGPVVRGFLVAALGSLMLAFIIALFRDRLADLALASWGLRKEGPPDRAVAVVFVNAFVLCLLLWAFIALILVLAGVG